MNQALDHNQGHRQPPHNGSTPNPAVMAIGHELDTKSSCLFQAHFLYPILTHALTCHNGAGFAVGTVAQTALGTKFDLTARWGLDRDGVGVRVRVGLKVGIGVRVDMGYPISNHHSRERRLGIAASSLCWCWR